MYGYGVDGDVLIAITTSGKSKNVIEAAKVAKAKAVKVISLTGRDESLISTYSDVTIRVPERETFKVQELHLPVYHAICAAVESRMFEGVDD